MKNRILTKEWIIAAHQAILNSKADTKGILTAEEKKRIKEINDAWCWRHRDPKRIKRILGKLEEIWSKSADMRFGQLLINLGVAPNSQFWNVEDDVTEKKLMDFKGWNK